MTGKDCYLDTLRCLASMPFLDRLELAALSGRADRTTYNAVADLERRRLAASLPHATDLLRTTQRFYVTAAGLRYLASADGMSLDRLLHVYPVSAQWRRILLERLDAVAVVYRLAATTADEEDDIAFRWYRTGPLDAAMSLTGGRTIGIARQGATADRTAFAKRLWKLREGPLPGAVLLLAPDAVRLHHARRLLAGLPTAAFLAQEEDAALAGCDDPVWHPPSISASLDLRYILSRMSQGGTLPEDSELSRVTLPKDIAVDGEEGAIPGHLLPALLKPAEKRTLDILSDWPWITSVDLCQLLGFSKARLSQVVVPLERAGLVRRPFAEGRRLALTDSAIDLLARRDRAAVGAARKRWSTTGLDSQSPTDWRRVSGRRSRQLLRNIDHTDAVHGFVASLAEQASSQGWEVAQLDPPGRAARYFRYGDNLRSIHPDAFGILRKDNRMWPFFLEWERRAVRPTTMAARLAPYLRYYSSHRPTDDHGARPIVLVVFDDDLAQTHFLRLAGEEMERARVQVPLRVSHKAALEESGPLGRAWRTSDSWEPTYALGGG